MKTLRAGGVSSYAYLNSERSTDAEFLGQALNRQAAGYPRDGARGGAQGLYREAVRTPAAALEGLMVSVISAADMMMVGTIGPAAIAAVGLTAQPRMILLILSQAINIGTTALVARRRGRKEKGVRTAWIRRCI